MTISDWGENFCEVKWVEPADDGGADVQGYVVEMRNRNRRGWNKVGATNSAEERTLNVTQVSFVRLFIMQIHMIHDRQYN